jgi:hypothetical protein
MTEIDSFYGELSNEAVDMVALRAEQFRSMLLTPAGLAALPPPEPLIEDYLTRDSLVVTYGRPGTIKSLIAISQALAVVTGTDWFGHPVHRGPVLYVVGEGTSGLAQRQQAWMDACGIFDLEGLIWLPYAVNLLQNDSVAALAEIVAELGAVLVVIDTLARSMVGGDENRSGDMAQAVEACDTIRRKSGATVDLVHHTPKAGDTPRGHSALEGAADTMLLLERSEAVFTLSVAKQKDLPQVTPLTFELLQQSGSVVPTLRYCQGDTASQFGIVGAELELRDLIGSVCGSDGLPATRLIELSKMAPRTFYRALKALDRRGVTRNVGTEHRPRWVLAYEEPAAILPILPNAAMAATETLLPCRGSLDPGSMAVTGVGGTNGAGTKEELAELLDLVREDDE